MVLLVHMTPPMLMQSSALDSTVPFPKDNSNQRGSVYVIPYFSMTKQLVAPLLCERAPLVCSDPCSPNYTVRPHVTAATGVATSLCPGCNEDERKAGEESGWFWPEWVWKCQFFIIVCFFYSTTPSPVHRRWGPSPRSRLTWSKENRWAWIVSYLLGCQWPLARSKNLWGELKHPQVAVGQGLSSDLIWPGSSAHWGTNGWCCKKTTYNPWHQSEPPPPHRPLQDGPK